ncbi:unnamed protein product [Lactuca saligna]|uniref:Uncharacterized protein n=1 Tax=Lactuca saligna TaxID=75948 RepID=A0AA36E2I1_LACSI|nr:unnamed protein product [Lactuca saligna]
MVSWYHLWMTYGSLVNIVLVYGVIVTPMDDISVMVVMVCYYGSQYFFEEAIKKSKEIANRHAIGSDGEGNSRLGKNFNYREFQDEECMKLFFLEADHEGKTMLEEASTLGHLDSTFVMGMMLTA